MPTIQRSLETFLPKTLFPRISFPSLFSSSAAGLLCNSQDASPQRIFLPFPLASFGPPRPRLFHFFPALCERAGFAESELPHLNIIPPFLRAPFLRQLSPNKSRLLHVCYPNLRRLAYISPRSFNASNHRFHCVCDDRGSVFSVP